MKPQSITVALAALACGVPPASANVIQYALTPLGPRPEAVAVRPWAISDDGTIVGAAHWREGALGNAFRLAVDGQFEYLPPFPVHNWVAGYDLAGSEFIVGETTIFTDYWYRWAAVWEQGTLTHLPGLPGAQQSSASGTNAAHVIVGGVFPGLSGGDQAAVRWTRGPAGDWHVEALPSSGLESSYASQVSEDGLIVGFGIPADDPFAYGPIVWSLSGPQLLPFDWGFGGTARDVNTSHTIIGAREIADPNREVHRAFIWEGDQAQEIPTPGWTSSDARAINERGDIVGWIERGDYGDEIRHAALFTGGLMQDLNDLIDPAAGWTLREAYDVDDLGRIVGVGIYNGRYQGFLLTPIPEPSTLCYGGLIAVTGIVALRPRKHASANVRRL